MDYQLESLSHETPQLPEVVIDGHKVAAGSAETLADIYQLINMANIAKIRKVAEDEVSAGWVENWDPVISSSNSPFEIKPTKAGQSLSLVNDGPAIVEVELNHRDFNFREVVAGQSYCVDFKGHKLYKIYLSNTDTLPATVHIVIKG